LYNPCFRKRAQKCGVWEAALFHEAMHCLPEFFVPWYSVIDVLPEELKPWQKTLIPNLIEDIIINHTLWLWEISPIRTTNVFRKLGIIKELIQYWEGFKFAPPLPASISAVFQFFSEIHMKSLQKIMQNRNETELSIDIHLKNPLSRELINPILNNIALLLNQRAVSLSLKNRTIEVYLDITRKDSLKVPHYETRLDGKTIPQYIPANFSYISQIYDLLDIHFAKSYDVDLKNLRRRALDAYKKRLKDKMKTKKTISPTNSDKTIYLDWKSYIENTLLVYDFGLKSSQKHSKKKQSYVSSPHYSDSNYLVKQVINEKSSITNPWERWTRIKISELLRLEKHIDTTC
jgi:hypothetical protein